MLTTEPGSGIPIEDSLIKYHDDYSAEFTELLNDAKITTILEKYGFSDPHNIKIQSANETNTWYLITFYSNEQHTLVEFGNDVCLLLPELLSDHLDCAILFIYRPSVSGIHKN